MIRHIGAIASSAILVVALHAQDAWAAPDYKLINSIAACRTVRCVLQYRLAANDKLEKIVLNARLLTIDPSSRPGAIGLLDNLPATEDEEVALFTLPDWHEGATNSVEEMKRLDKLYESWASLLSVAVERNLEYLPNYIRYGRLAVDDIHSDYTAYEQKVCRADPGRFRAAFLTLSADDQNYLRTYVFRPDDCKPIFVSEAKFSESK